MAMTRWGRIPVGSRIGRPRPGLEADLPFRSQLCVNKAVEERGVPMLAA